MKIIYLHQYFNTPAMTGGTRSYEMARRLVAMGHDVEMITSLRTSDASSGSWRVTNETGIKVHWFPVPYSNHMSYNQRIKAFFDFAWEATKKARSIDGDIVFATSTPLTIIIPAFFSAKRNQIPLVFEVRDLWPEMPIAIGAIKNRLVIWAARKLESFAYNNSSRIVALSPGMKEGVVATGYPEERVRVIPNSSDVDMFDCEGRARGYIRGVVGLKENDFLVLYAGTFGAVNGVDYLVKVAYESMKAGFSSKFVIIGDGSEVKKIKKIAEDLNVLNKNFYMLPPIAKEKMPDVFADADLSCSLFVDLKAMWANSANKFFDSLASGTPVAINYGGWQSEIIKEKNAGIVLPCDDVKMAAAVINDFSKNNNKRNECALQAKILATNVFSRDKLAVDLEKVLIAARTEYEQKAL